MFINGLGSTLPQHLAKWVIGHHSKGANFGSLAEDEQTLEANKPKKTELSVINEVCHTLLFCLKVGYR